MPIDSLDAAALRAIVVAFRDALGDHRESINNLNVYPVPDGDTGTNMSLTLVSVVEELDGLGEDADVEAVCDAVAHGSLMGARGNSGVIMSQILRGFAGVVKTKATIDGAAFAEAWAAAAEGAYGAVGNPVEGTILTVVRESSDAAVTAAAEGKDLVGVLDAARVEGGESLERTPTLLKVLADAGVVDAGGAGLLLFLDAALHVTDDRAMPEPTEVVPPAEQARPEGDDHEPSIADLRYEVMFLLDAPDNTIEGFKSAWAEVGDSIVVVGGDGMFNCHIHCDDIGAAIECGIDVGRPHKIRVTDLLEELAELEEQAWVAAEIGQPAETPAGDPVPTAVVAVGLGPGVVAILRSMGVHAVVAGGQSMNPSTAELVAAVESVPAPEVVILPNNKNIIPVAEQVDAQSSRTVRVVPTKGIAEGLACLMAYDPQSTAEANAANMTGAAAAVVAGEVTQSVRESTSDAGPIVTGDWLGICRDGITAVQPTMVDAATGLLASILDDDHELLTVIAGEDATDEATAAIEAWIGEHHPDVEVEVHDGGQPLYPYYFGLE
ncbi:MAG: DAK2 domain-containing protein [Acidimicrobiales bacterium]|nr:DAK2 domain-containing protein [Acidimicrobiales bacterium]